MDRYYGIGAGDRIRLSDHQLAPVLFVIHVAVDGDDYNFIRSITPIEEDWIEFYTYGGAREEAHEPA
jgi:hypothetical protein